MPKQPSMLLPLSRLGRFFREDRKHYAAGELAFVPQELATVSLHTNFEDDVVAAIAKIFHGPESLQDILGFTPNGEFLWIPHALFSNRKLSFPGYPVVKLGGIRVFAIASAIQPSNDTGWIASKHAFRNMNNWFGNAIQKQPLEVSQDWLTATTSVTVPKPTSIDASITDAVIQANFLFDQSSTDCSNSIVVQGFLEVKPNTPQPYEWHLEMSNDLLLMMTFFTFEPSPRKYLITHAEPFKQDEMTFRPEAYWYLTQQKAQADETKSQDSMLLPFEFQQHNMSAIIERFFAEKKRIRPSVELLVNSIFEMYQGGYSDFLALAQAIETYYVALHGDVGTFKQKLEGVFDDLDPLVQVAINLDRNGYLECLKEHRHKIAHNDIAFLEGIDQPTFIALTFDTRRFAAAALLSHLGLAPQEIVQALNRAIPVNYKLARV